MAAIRQAVKEIPQEMTRRVMEILEIVYNNALRPEGAINDFLDVITLNGNLVSLKFCNKCFDLRYF